MLPDQTSGKPASYSIPLVDDQGAAIAATGVTWKLFDELGDELSTGAGTIASGAAEFTIPQGNLTLNPSVTSAGRELVVYAATATAGTFEIRNYFILLSPAPLVRMVNSFVTYLEALNLRRSFASTMNGWDAALDDTKRSAALAHAFSTISRMRFNIPFTDGQSVAQNYAAYGTGEDVPFGYTRRVRLINLTEAQFDELPEQFKYAVRRAQMVEADNLLGGNKIEAKRRDGIISETIGESSMFFSSKPYLHTPVCKEAYRLLQPYIEYEFKVGRG